MYVCVCCWPCQKAIAAVHTATHICVCVCVCVCVLVLLYITRHRALWDTHTQQLVDVDVCACALYP